jgi:hypothetical protein
MFCGWCWFRGGCRSLCRRRVSQDFCQQVIFTFTRKRILCFPEINLSILFTFVGIWPFNSNIFPDNAFVADKKEKSTGVTKETRILRKLMPIPERAVKKGGEQASEILTSTPYIEMAEARRRRYQSKKTDVPGNFLSPLN